MDSLEDILREKSGAFSFENSARNASLEKMGVRLPKLTKTGTTIVGSSACGAGTAADLDQVTKLLSSNLKLLEQNTERKAPVIAAARMAKQHLFSYHGYVEAYLVIGGIDFYGPRLNSCSAFGDTSIDPYTADGSGSLAALGVLERQFKLDMTEEEAIELVKNALTAGMHSDLSSGNSLRFCVIRKEGARQFDRVVPDFCTAPPKELSYANTDKTEVLKAKHVKFDVVEAMETESNPIKI